MAEALSSLAFVRVPFEDADLRDDFSDNPERTLTQCGLSNLNSADVYDAWALVAEKGTADYDRNGGNHDRYPPHRHHGDHDAESRGDVFGNDNEAVTSARDTPAFDQGDAERIDNTVADSYNAESTVPASVGPAISSGLPATLSAQPANRRLRTPPQQGRHEDARPRRHPHARHGPQYRTARPSRPSRPTGSTCWPPVRRIARVGSPNASAARAPTSS